MKLNFAVKVIRAALVVALLAPQILLAQSKSAKSETYKDIIEKAYNLSLQKDRQQALNILISALQKESRPQAVQELRKAIGDVAHVFISDKAQQMYEAGISLRKTDLVQALNKLNEAQRIEPDNAAIIEELSRSMIAKGDCSGAQDLLSKQSKLVAYDEELKLSLAQAQVCQAQWLDFSKTLDGVELRKSSLQKFWLILEVEHYFKVKNLTKAQEFLMLTKKLDGKYPELSYWSWKISQAVKKVSLDEAQKYVITCKNISANQYRLYMIDPLLCRRVFEVEADLKGTNGTSE